jgi:hypothetical protein
MKGGMCLVLWGLAVLLFSCEKEGVLEGSGEKVMVNISLGDVFYGGNETVTRGYAEMEETVQVPLGDGLFMYTTIEKNREAEMRAGEPLEDGVKVRVVAYNGTTAESTVEYTVLNGALTTATALEVSTGVAYTFVAYSYNSTTSPDYPGPTITVASPHDLLYGKEPKTITAMDNSVYITMSHLFAQVKVKATTTSVAGQPVIKSMSGVTVTPGNPVDLTIATGAVAQNAAAAAQAILTWNDLNTTTVMSDPITVNTGSSNPIYVNISSVTIDGYLAFTGIKAEFKKALAAGYSYTLVVNFKRTIWAKSNIYWVSTGGNSGYLTFDTQENGNQGYQGVFFKWGSLVGVSPAQVGGSDAFLSQDVPIYVPIVNSTLENSTWVATTGSSVMADVPETTSNWTTWGDNTENATDIPYLGPSYGTAGTVAFGRDNRFVIDADRNTATMYEGFRGDICQYLSKTGAVTGDYRMPTSNEFGSMENESWNASTPNGYGWMKGIETWPSSANTAAGCADGTADLLDAAFGTAINRPMGDIVFPASGYRSFDNGTLYDVGNLGVYWSGSAEGVNGVYILRFNDSWVRSTRYVRSHGYSVRCVQN